MIDDATWAALERAARDVQQRAWAPYSQFRVGAAVLTEDGQIFAGCNVENASYGATICAERTAVGSAVAAGHTRLVACVVVGPLADAITPCGICRQVLSEFGPDMPVRCVAELDLSARLDTTIPELLPGAFSGVYLRR
jgi:cytidine deaminase